MIAAVWKIRSFDRRVKIKFERSKAPINAATCGASEHRLLVVQTNLSSSYAQLGRREEGNRMMRDVYSGRLKLNGKEHEETLLAANNYALSLLNLQRYTEIKSLLRRSLPMARRVLGEGHRLTLSMRSIYAEVLYKDASSTLDDLREAVTTLEEIVPTTRRVFGGAHPLTKMIEKGLRAARAALRSRDTPPSSA